MQLIENMFSIEQLKVIRGLQNFDKLSFTGSASLIMAGVDIQRPIGDLDFVTTDEATFNHYKKTVENILAKTKEELIFEKKPSVSNDPISDYSDIFDGLVEKLSDVIDTQIIKNIAVEKVTKTDELFEGATELSQYLTKMEKEDEDYERDYEGSREFFVSKKNKHVKLTVNGIGVCIFYKEKESLIKPLIVYIDTTVMEGENTTYTRLETSFIDPAYSIEAKMGYLNNYHFMLAQEDMIWHGQVKRWKKHKEDILKYLEWFEQQVTDNLEEYEDFKSSK